MYRQKRNNTTQLNTNNMEKLKTKVIERLIKGGFNPADVVKMVEKHFDYASRVWKTPAKIAECIICLD